MVKKVCTELVTNFWRQGREASFHLKSLNNGQAEMSLAFRLPHPREIIPPPSPYPIPSFPTSNSTRPAAPTPPKRPIIPLFPPGQAPKLKQRKSPVKQPAPQAPAPPAPAQATPSHSHRRAMLLRASQATPSLPPALPGTLRWQCAGLLQRAIAAATCPQPAAPHLQQHSPEAPNSTPLQAPQSSGKRLHSPSPETLSHRLRLESLRETPLPSSPGSPTLNLTPVPSPKRDDLPRQEQEEEKAGESSDVEEEEKSKDWTDQEEEKSSDIKEEVKSKEAEAKKLAKEKVCETAGCKNPVPRGRGSPKCKTRCIQILLLPGLFQQQLDLAQGGAQEGKGGGGVHSLLLRDGGGVQEVVYLPVSGT